jgi:hypothetical protein
VSQYGCAPFRGIRPSTFRAPPGFARQGCSSRRIGIDAIIYALLVAEDDFSRYIVAAELLEQPTNLAVVLAKAVPLQASQAARGSRLARDG